MKVSLKEVVTHKFAFENDSSWSWKSWMSYLQRSGLCFCNRLFQQEFKWSFRRAILLSLSESNGRNNTFEMLWCQQTCWGALSDSWTDWQSSLCSVIPCWQLERLITCLLLPCAESQQLHLNFEILPRSMWGNRKHFFNCCDSDCQIYAGKKHKIQFVQQSCSSVKELYIVGQAQQQHPLLRFSLSWRNSVTTVSIQVNAARAINKQTTTIIII